MCTFSVTQEITISGSNEAQTDCSWVDKSPKASVYVREQINFYLRLEFLMCAIPRFILKKYVL